MRESAGADPENHFYIVRELDPIHEMKFTNIRAGASKHLMMTVCSPFPSVQP